MSSGIYRTLRLEAEEMCRALEGATVAARIFGAALAESLKREIKSEREARIGMRWGAVAMFGSLLCAAIGAIYF